MQILSPNAFDCASFYRERDNRTNLTLAQGTTPVPLAVSIAPAWAETINGQITLYWLVSLISRMGERYNQLELFMSTEVQNLNCLIPGLSGKLGQVILDHLQASDPCGSYQMVSDIDGQAALISVGRLEGRRQHIVVQPCGWAAMIATSDGVLTTNKPKAGLNPIGAALAAALGAAETYFQFNQDKLQGRQSQMPIWISARHCAVTNSADEAAKWEDDEALPTDIDIGRWLVVGAGALGGNTLAILGMARENLKGVLEIVDPDLVDLTNLNRLIESLVTHVKTCKKVDLAAFSFRDSNVKVTPRAVPYENLRASQLLQIEDFKVVISGVDQMSTRAFVQSDWPRLLVDGGTRGYTWRVSTIENGGGGYCLGCLAGKSQRHYSDLQSPLRCVIGLPEQTLEPLRPMDSYGFVSFFAAAFMAARGIEQCLSIDVRRCGFTTAVALNLRQLQHRQDRPSKECLCMCGHPSVKDYREGKYRS